MRTKEEVEALRYLAVEVSELLSKLRDAGTALNRGSAGSRADVSVTFRGVKFIVTIEQE